MATAAPCRRPENRVRLRCGSGCDSGVVVLRFYHLHENNAPRACGECGNRGTAYVHGVGFRCGDCGNVPGKLRGGME